MKAAAPKLLGGAPCPLFAPALLARANPKPRISRCALAPPCARHGAEREGRERAETAASSSALGTSSASLARRLGETHLRPMMPAGPVLAAAFPPLGSLEPGRASLPAPQDQELAIRPGQAGTSGPPQRPLSDRRLRAQESAVVKPEGGRWVAGSSSTHREVGSSRKLVQSGNHQAGLRLNLPELVRRCPGAESRGIHASVM
ncbi:UNVERIFIED_CONTAM: hypothetical protein K2H54_056694 [Gekko kuhli]